MTEKLKPASDLNELADGELIRLTRRGDGKAFEVLVRRYQKLVYNIVYQMVRSHEAAADLTQDSFIKAYRALSGFQEGRSFKPWLLRIATNTTLNSIRDNKRLSSLEEVLDRNPQAEPLSLEDVEEEVEWRLNHQLLFEALGELPVKQREAFVLRYQHDLPYDDIAEIQGTTVSSVKSLLFRARDNLRNLLQARMKLASTDMA